LIRPFKRLNTLRFSICRAATCDAAELLYGKSQPISFEFHLLKKCAERCFQGWRAHPDKAAIATALASPVRYECRKVTRGLFELFEATSIYLADHAPASA